MLNLSPSQRARRDKANHFLRWRKRQGGAVLINTGGVASSRRKQAQRAEADFLAPVDQYLAERSR